MLVGNIFLLLYNGNKEETQMEITGNDEEILQKENVQGKEYKKLKLRLEEVQKRKKESSL